VEENFALAGVNFAGSPGDPAQFFRCQPLKKRDVRQEGFDVDWVIAVHDPVAKKITKKLGIRAMPWQ
jgi:hypothetical protein